MAGAIFDLDGTLIDSYAAHFQAWTVVASELGHDLTEGQFAGQFGLKNESIIAQLHEFIGRPVPDVAAVDALADRKESIFRGCIGGGDFPLMPGACALLADLRTAGWSLAVGSSAPQWNIDFAMERFEALGVTFDAIACGCDVPNGKPAPDVFLLAARRLGLEPACCVVFEDASAGVEAGLRAGMPTIGIASTGRTRGELEAADLVIDAFGEVHPALLASLL